MTLIKTAGAAALVLLLGACSSTDSPRGVTATSVTTTANAAGSTTVTTIKTQPSEVPAALTGPWQRQIATVLADPALDGAQVSLTVRDAASGQTLYAHEPRNRGVPASSLKLVTSAAAMAVLGPDYRFATQLASNGAVRGGVLDGNLYLRGTGDPTLSPDDYRQLAATLARSGVRSVRGDLLLDDTWFDRQRLGTEWANDDESEPFAAQISALNLVVDDRYNVGSVHVTATAGARAGAPVNIAIDPPTRYVTLVNSATSGAGAGLKVEREHGGNRIDVSGNLAPRAVDANWISVWEPTGLVADVFRQALQAEGITVQGQTRLGVATPPGAQVLADHRSMPLAELIRPLLKQSNNGIAEVLLKSMGRQAAQQGTAAAGIEAVSAFLTSQGIDAEQLRQFDGSGLSRRNLISSQLFTDVLLAARRQSWFPAWYAAMPIAGTGDRVTGGTLRNRLKGTTAQNNLHAKTGSMGAVSSLTGYVTAADGRLLAFSMVSNNFLASEGRVKRLEDEVVRALLVSGD